MRRILPHNDYHAMLLGYRAATKQEMQENNLNEDLCQLLKLDAFDIAESADLLTRIAEKIIKNKTDLTQENRNSYIQYISNMLININMRANNFQLNTVNRFTLATSLKARSSARHAYNMMMLDFYIQLNRKS